MVRPGCGTELTTRSDGVTLPARDGELLLKPLLNAESGRDAWRIIEVFSLSAAPFDLRLSWSSGGGSGANAKITVSRAARICVFARSLRIQAANLSDTENRVGVTVADGHTRTRNQWEVRGTATESTPEGIEIPPFAERLRLDLSDPAYVTSAEIEVYDGQDILRSRTIASGQPSDGLPVGGAGKVEVTIPSSIDYRVVFTLSL